MGGSGRGGGGWFETGRSIGDWAAAVRTAAGEAANESFEAESNEYLNDLLKTFNDRPDDITDRVRDIEDVVNSEIEGTTRLMFGGSMKKHTYVDGLSDVDALMIVNKSELANASPQQVLAFAAEVLAKQFQGVATVKAGALAVTVRYNDGVEVQVLPALKTATGVRIAGQDGQWSNVVKPHKFAEKLTSVNQAQGNKVVPVVKLFKGLQGSLPENSRLKGYHVESLAIEAFESYTGPRNTRAMLKHLVREAATRVLTPIKESTGQSLHVDDYLGNANSVERQRAASTLNRVASKLESAESARSAADIKALFGD